LIITAVGRMRRSDANLGQNLCQLSDPFHTWVSEATDPWRWLTAPFGHGDDALCRLLVPQGHENPNNIINLTLSHVLREKDNPPFKVNPEEVGDRIWCIWQIYWLWRGYIRPFGDPEVSLRIDKTNRSLRACAFHWRRLGADWPLPFDMGITFCRLLPPLCGWQGQVGLASRCPLRIARCYDSPYCNRETSMQ
jgi:hypothetical protein